MMKQEQVKELCGWRGLRSRLWVMLVVGLLVGLVALAAACGGDGAPPAGPRLVFDGDEFDLGVIGADETVERTVPFRNEGVEPLTVSILKVRAAPGAACGCGVESFEVRPEAVQPGATGELVFRLKAPEGMKREMEDNMLAELQSNDPDRPEHTITLLLRMGAEVEPEGGSDGS